MNTNSARRKTKTSKTGRTSPSIQVRGDQGFIYLKLRGQSQLQSKLRSISDGTYVRFRREWRFPLRSLPLLQSEVFEPGKNLPISFVFLTSWSQIEELYSAYITRQREASKRIQQDPFRAWPKDIEIVQPEVVFNATKAGRIEASLGSSPQLRVLVEDFASVQSEEVGKFLISVNRLNSLVSKLRDCQFRFAISRSLGEKLVDSALKRLSILSGQDSGDSGELSEAFLLPHIAKNGVDSYHLVGATKVEFDRLSLKRLTPSKRKNRQLTLSDVSRLIFNGACQGVNVWLDRETEADLLDWANSVSSTQVSEKLALFAEPHPALMVTCWNEPALLVGEDFDFSEIGLSGVNYRESLWTLSIGSRSVRRLLVFEEDEYERIEEALATRLPDQFQTQFQFLEWKERLGHRITLLKERQKYQQLRDLSLDLSNSQLESALFPHQRIGVGWLIQREATILGDDMGLGKTLTVLAAFDELLSREVVDFLLVIAPNSLVKNWIREAHQWIPNISILPLPKATKERRKLLASFDLLDSKDLTQGLVLNYEAARLPEVNESLVELCSTRRVMLCLDESQRIKNPLSKTFQAISVIAERCPRRVLLSGTPTPKNISDIWSQMHVVDQGERFGSNFYQWLGSVAELGNQYSEVAVRRFIPNRVNQTIGRVREVMLRRSKESVLNLPEKLFSIRDIELKGAQRDRYEEIRKELRLKMTSLSGKVFTREVQSILEQYLRAVQVASNPRLIDSSWRGEPAKFLELDQIVEELVEQGDQKLVIWTNFLGNVDELLERYERYDPAPFSGQVSPAERDLSVKAFQESDRVRIFIAVPAAGGVGITLTRAQTAVYLDKSWNAEHWLQSIDRIHRIGQTGAVNIISLHASKVDWLISKNLKRKEIAQRKLLDSDDSGLYGSSCEIGEGDLPSQQELLEAVS